MKKGAYIIFLVYIIISFIGVTFAWMSQASEPVGQAAVFEYGDGGYTLDVESREITFKLYAYNQNNDSYVYTDDLNDVFKYSKLVPNGEVKFKMEFSNKGLKESHIQLELVNMNTNYNDFFEYLYFVIYDAKGYTDDVTINPIGTYVKLNDNIKETAKGYNTTLMNKLYLTPTTNEDKIEIYAYFLLSRFADNDFQEKNFSLGYFRAVLV